MLLGKLPVPGRPTMRITVGQGPTALAVGAGGGCLDIFTLIYPFFPLSPSLWETARYRLKYCLKWPFIPKTTNQSLRGQLIKGFTTLYPKYADILLKKDDKSFCTAKASYIFFNTNIGIFQTLTFEIFTKL